MAKVTISNLFPTEKKLLPGEDSLLHELSEQEINHVLGGAINCNPINSQTLIDSATRIFRTIRSLFG
ncbi:MULTISPECIES: hypothetical protein [unclassified Anabaena]|uniref:hypothetical protein n=1 Tax=unclassified Anabaena TaxID=2619674 RepID=UPI00082B1C6A|nr:MULTISPECIES: hypothetical protein [unclassified Anabaena]